MLHHPHHEKHVPKFCKKYAQLGVDAHNALSSFRDDIINGSFPSDLYSPFSMSEEETTKFNSLLLEDIDLRSHELQKLDEKIRNADARLEKFMIVLFSNPVHCIHRFYDDMWNVLLFIDFPP